MKVLLEIILTTKKTTMGRNQKPEKHFLEENIDYHIKYIELCKQARVWQNSSQYWLAKECERRAQCLMNGSDDGLIPVRSEKLLQKTKRLM